MVNYAFKDFSKHTVKAYGNNLDISVKTAINICNKLRGMNATKALAFLDRVTKKEEAVPFTRFTDGVGHRPGMAAGRYPLKASKAIGDVISSAISNAANQGFGDELKIIHICAHKAGTPMHQGRQRRRVMKRTHIEVVLKESEAKPAKVTKQSSTKKTTEKKKADTSKAATPTVDKQTTDKQNPDKLTADQPNPVKVEEKKVEVKTESKEDSKEKSNSSSQETKPEATKQ